ncbi:MAG: signal-transducing histidine kinase [Bacteroidetes bacterium]|nr:MAG: signal-transducing histidine kinase [Bacteroidota bacterium]
MFADVNVIIHKALTDQSSVSKRLTSNLTGWINRCYSIHPVESSFQAFMNEFAENIFTLKGIYGVWIFGQSPDNPGLKLIASCAEINKEDHAVLTKSFRRGISSLEEPWKIVSRNFRKSQLFVGRHQLQPDNELSVFMLPGFNIDGKVVVVIVAEAELEELFTGTLPGMFQNILEYSKLRYENTDSIYRLLVENQNELIVKVDARGRFLFVSPTYCKLFGMDPGQLIGQSYEPLIHPDDLEITASAMKQLDHYPHTCYVEQRAQTVLGWRWLAWSDKAVLDDNGNIIAVIGVGRDISEQKKIEKELVESELKFQKAFRNSPNLMSISRMSDGLILDLNDKFLSILQLPREKIIGKTTVELGLYSDIPRIKIQEQLKQYGRIEDIEITMTRLNTKIEGLFSSEIIELNGEKCLVSSFNDITELKSAQRELDTYRIHLEGLVEQRTARIREVNEELDRFAHSVSHDLKAPLRVMQGFVNAIIEDHSDNLDSEVLKYLHRINKSSLQMEALINDLLQYSRLSSLELNLKAVNPAIALGKTLEILSDEIGAKKAVIVVADELPFVRSYMPVLVQVFTNLISNSIKFVGDGIIPKVLIKCRIKDDKVHIIIKDNGIGIPPDKQKRIFDVFERLHGVESFPGIGIGLTIVKKAMERMGGEVLVKSSPGKGSEFILVMQSVK